MIKSDSPDSLVSALRLLGLAKKAGMLGAGEYQAEKAIKSGVCALCLLAQDASDNTKKHFGDMCSNRKQKTVVLPATKERLGRSVGKNLVAVLTVNDNGLAQKILKLL